LFPLYYSLFNCLRTIQTRAELEFKVYNEVFCDQFKILRSQFRFDTYVERVYEKFLLDIITIRPMDWFAVVALGLLNYGRLTLEIHFPRSGCNNTECRMESDLMFFVMVGVGILICALGTSMLSRVYERRLLGTRGVETMLDCIVFLRYSETQPRESVRQKRLSSEDLKTALQKIKAKNLQAKDDHRANRIQNRRQSVDAQKGETPRGAAPPPPPSWFQLPSIPLPDFSKVTDVVSDGLKHLPFRKSKVEPGDLIRSKSIRSSKSTKVHNRSKFFPSFGGGDDDSSGGNASGHFNSAHIGGGGNSNTTSRRILQSNPSMGPGVGKMARDSRFFSKRGRHVLQPSTSWAVSSDQKKQFGEDIVRIFWLDNPTLYFESVQLQIMIISCYLGLWISNYGAVALRMHHDNTFWVIITGLPGLLSVILNMYTVRCAALLKAVSALDKDIVEEVLERVRSFAGLFSGVCSSYYVYICMCVCADGSLSQPQYQSAGQDIKSTHQHRPPGGRN
jgi:hypothetical protein